MSLGIDIGTSNLAPATSKPYRYDELNQNTKDYHINKRLEDDIIMPINSPFASQVVLCKKNNEKSSGDPEAWRFAFDYRKLTAIMQYPQFLLRVIDEILANTTNTTFMSILDLTSLTLFLNFNEARGYN